jgi:hypothetical protein
VLITIADAANKDGERARPGMDAMVSGSLYSQGHVSRTLTALQRFGWLEIVKPAGPGAVAEYALRDPATGLGINGRGEARLFALPDEVNVARPDARRSDASSRGRRANVARPDARRSDADTSCPNYVNGNGKDPAAPPRATDDPIKRHAHRLAVFAHEQPQKPVTRGGFPAVMARIEAELVAGTSVQHIQAAIEAGDITWTADGFRMAISRAKPTVPRTQERRDGDGRTTDELLAVAVAEDARRST